MHTANTGGLLGLFMGFSVVSIVEIVYFLSVRPYCASLRTNSNAVEKKITTKATAAEMQKNAAFENVYPYVN